MNHEMNRKSLLTLTSAMMLCLISATAANTQAKPVPARGGNSSLAQQSLVGGMQLITPEDLVKILQAPKGVKPLILNIGPRVLYAQAHIPGAEFIGPTSEPQSLEALRIRVKSLPRGKLIVVYCGCCPWNHCPNVQPAYKMLSEMGFKRAAVLYIANNIGVDWVYRGYPTTRGQ